MLRSTLDLASSLERARRRPHKRTCHINAERLAARQVHAKSRLGCGTALDHFLPTGMGGVSKPARSVTGSQAQPMGRKSITGGVRPAGLSRIRFDFNVDGHRFRPTLPWIPNETNLQRARAHLARIKAQIAAGTFYFADEFPRYRGLQKLPPVLQHRTCGEVFDDFLRHEEARLARGDLAAATVTSHRKILDHVWRPHLAEVPFLGVRYSMLIKIADAYPCNKKTYNNAVSALRRAFDFGYLDYPERRDPAASLKCARIGKNDRPPIDPFSIQDAEVLIAAIHQDWGEAQGNYDELRFFTGLRPSEEIALVVTDYDAAHGVLSITKARVLGIDKDVTKTGEDRRIRRARQIHRKRYIRPHSHSAPHARAAKEQLG